jgi:UDP-4-amino-4,6-dideoxy-N-acetyl-beta-L-altrosamine transaminase
MLKSLPYGKQSIDDADIAAVVEALKSPTVTQGPLIERFEKAIGLYVAAPHVSVMSNGTAALQLAYAALGLTVGDEIITSPITFAATANAARALDADVCFCDVEPDTGNMDIASIETLIGPRTRGIVAVHFGGLPVDMAALRTLADRHGLWIVEDAAHAFGASYRETPTGSCRYSDATTFSFHPVKHITTGEGGAVAVKDPALKRTIDRLRHHGVERNVEYMRDRSGAPWYYEVQSLGWNYRITDIQCALGLSQLNKQPGWLEHRREVAATYRDLIAATFGDAVRCQAERSDRVSAYHLMPVLIDFAAFGRSRAEVMLGLREHGVGTQVHYIPVNQQPYYRELYGAPQAQPGVDGFYASELSLPMYATLEIADVARVVAALDQELSRREYKEQCK